MTASSRRRQVLGVDFRAKMVKGDTPSSLATGKSELGRSQGVPVQFASAMSELAVRPSCTFHEGFFTAQKMSGGATRMVITAPMT